MHIIFHLLYTILYIQYVKIFNECTQFCTFVVHSFSKNGHNFILSMDPINSFNQIINFLYSMFTSFHGIYTNIFF